MSKAKRNDKSRLSKKAKKRLEKLAKAKFVRSFAPKKK